MKSVRITAISILLVASSFAADSGKILDEKNTHNSPGKKSAPLAFFLSLLIPGAGEYYLGAKRAHLIFDTVEALSWISFTGFRLYGSWLGTDAKAYAAQKAGVDLNSREHDEKYFNTISQYMSIDSYNNAQSLSDDPEYYEKDKGFFWHWDENDDRITYFSLKNNGKLAETRAKNIIGIVVLNHIISALTTLRIARQTSYALQPTTAVNFSLIHKQQTTLLAVSKSF